MTEPMNNNPTAPSSNQAPSQAAPPPAPTSPAQAPAPGASAPSPTPAPTQGPQADQPPAWYTAMRDAGKRNAERMTRDIRRDEPKPADNSRAEAFRQRLAGDLAGDESTQRVVEPPATALPSADPSPAQSPAPAQAVAPAEQEPQHLPSTIKIGDAELTADQVAQYVQGFNYYHQNLAKFEQDRQAAISTAQEKLSQAERVMADYNQRMSGPEGVILQALSTNEEFRNGVMELIDKVAPNSASKVAVSAADQKISDLEKRVQEFNQREQQREQQAAQAARAAQEQYVIQQVNSAVTRMKAEMSIPDSVMERINDTALALYHAGKMPLDPGQICGWYQRVMQAEAESIRAAVENDRRSFAQSRQPAPPPPPVNAGTPPVSDPAPKEFGRAMVNRLAQRLRLAGMG